MLSQRGQKHDGVAMLMTPNHPPCLSTSSWKVAVACYSSPRCVSYASSLLSSSSFPFPLCRQCYSAFAHTLCVQTTCAIKTSRLANLSKYQIRNLSFFSLLGLFAKRFEFRGKFSNYFAESDPRREIADKPRRMRASLPFTASCARENDYPSLAKPAFVCPTR